MEEDIWPHLEFNELEQEVKSCGEFYYFVCIEVLF